MEHHQDTLQEARKALTCLNGVMDLIQIQAHEIHLLKVRLDMQTIQMNEHLECLRTYATGKQDGGRAAQALLAAIAIR